MDISEVEVEELDIYSSNLSKNEKCNFGDTGPKPLFFSHFKKFVGGCKSKFFLFTYDDEFNVIDTKPIHGFSRMMNWDENTVLLSNDLGPDETCKTCLLDVERSELTETSFLSGHSYLRISRNEIITTRWTRYKLIELTTVHPETDCENVWKVKKEGVIEGWGFVDCVDPSMGLFLSKIHPNCFYCMMEGEEPDRCRIEYALFLVDYVNSKRLQLYDFNRGLRDYGVFYNNKTNNEYFFGLKSSFGLSLHDAKTFKYLKRIDFTTDPKQIVISRNLDSFVLVQNKYLVLNGEIRSRNRSISKELSPCFHIVDLHSNEVLLQNQKINEGVSPKGLINFTRNVTLVSKGRNEMVLSFASEMSGELKLVCIRSKKFVFESDEDLDVEERVQFIRNQLEEFVPQSYTLHIRIVGGNCNFVSSKFLFVL